MGEQWEAQALEPVEMEVPMHVLETKDDTESSFPVEPLATPWITLSMSRRQMEFYLSFIAPKSHCVRGPS